MVESKIIESAVKVLVASEIEAAGERVASRLCAAFGKLAKVASESTDISVNVTKQSGCVVVRIEYDSVIKAATEELVKELPVVDEQMIYTGDAEPAEPIETDWEISQRENAKLDAEIKAEERSIHMVICPQIKAEEREFVDAHIESIADESADDNLYSLVLEPGDIQMLEDDDMADLRMDDSDSV